MIRKKIFQKRDSLRYFSAGMTAEIVSCLIWLPIDITKERLQVKKKMQNIRIHAIKGSIQLAKLSL